MTGKPRKLEQVVDAAIAEFQEKGFSGANMDRVSERAHVSKRTLYNYFGSKDALFQEIVNRAGNHFVDSEPCVFSRDQDIGPQLYNLALRLVLPYSDAGAMKMARLVIGELLRNKEVINDMLYEIELATAADSFFTSAICSGAITKKTGDAVAVDFHAFLKGRCFWPAIISGDLVSIAEAEKVAKSASELFARRFVSA